MKFVIENGILKKVIDPDKKVVIPDTVWRIDDYVFYECSEIEEVIIPNSVIEIGKRSFAYFKNIKRLVIPDSIRKIEDYAFYACYSLKSVSIPKSVKKIGDFAFAWCIMLENITIPLSVSEVGKSIFRFSDCIKTPQYTETTLIYVPRKVSEFQIPSTIQEIAEYAFNECMLETINIPEGVKFLRDFAFKGSFLKSISMPDSMEKIGKEVFPYYANLITKPIYNRTKLFYVPVTVEKFEIHETIQEICCEAFKYCHSLTEIVIPDSVTKIGEYAFSCCGRLRKITIPETVTYIGKYAFQREEFFPQKEYGPFEIDIFEEKIVLEIHGKAGSYAEKYADEHNIKFIAE